MKKINLIKIDEVVSFLIEENICYTEDELIKYETYFKSGGKVKLHIKPSSTKKLSLILKHLIQNRILFKVIGHTSNTLFLDDIYYSVIISTKHILELQVSESMIEVSSGYPLSELVRVTLMEGLSGFEGLEGIPGTIAGAVFMNAGAYGYNISDTIEWVDVLNSQGEIQRLSQKECLFAFRTSIFKDNVELYILSVSFKIDRNINCSKAIIAEKIERFHIARHIYQEFAYPSMGSMFSTKQDMYKELLRFSLMQKISYWTYKLILKNPIVKFIQRKKPSNKVFNNVTLKYHNIVYPLSHKSINILINTGGVTSMDILNHIETMTRLYAADTQIENEVYVDNVLFIPKDIKYKLEQLNVK
jgi:UDP-N-acetylmuramate dehydrogenase